MNRLKIGTRLGLAFGLVLIVTALIAWIGIWRLAELKGASERIANVELERSALAHEWKAAIDVNWVRASASLKSGDAGYISTLGKDMAASSQHASEVQKKLEALVDDDKGKQLLAEVAKARAGYVGARAKLLERKRQARMFLRWWTASYVLWPISISIRFLRWQGTPVINWMNLNNRSSLTQRVASGHWVLQRLSWLRWVQFSPYGRRAPLPVRCCRQCVQHRRSATAI